MAVLTERAVNPRPRPVAGAPHPGGRLMVLHVVEAAAAGTLRHVVDLVRFASDVEHAVAVPSRHQGTSTADAVAALRAAGARVERIEMGRFRMPHAHASALIALRATILRLRPDVIHGHSSIGGAMARLAAVRTGIPAVYTPHGLTRSRWALRVERTLRGQTDRLIAVSESERQFALAAGVGRADRTVVIRNGIDPRVPPPLPPPRSLRASLGVSREVPLVGSVGRLTWQKAPEMFVAGCRIAGRSVPEAHFVLIGTGALHGVVATRVREAGIENRFHLIPLLPDAAAVLSELDVFVLPSRFEGGPYTVLEAMRAGTPVVVTDVAGSRDLVADGKNGLVVPPEDPERLGLAIARLLCDEALGERLAARARHTVSECDVRTMAASTAAVYRELTPARFVTRPHGATAPRAP